MPDGTIDAPSEPQLWTLPADVLEQIISKLEACELSALSACCSRLLHVVDLAVLHAAPSDWVDAADLTRLLTRFQHIRSLSVNSVDDLRDVAHQQLAQCTQLESLQIRWGGSRSCMHIACSHNFT